MYSVSRMGKHQPTTILTSYLVLKQDGKVLLALRQNTGYCDGQWGLPAGHVESGESMTTALCREIQEEIGIVLDPKQVQLKHVIHRKSDLDGSERIDGFFEADHWTGKLENLEPEKCGRLEWFPLNVLPDEIIPYVRETLQCMRQGIGYREVGW